MTNLNIDRFGFYSASSGGGGGGAETGVFYVQAITTTMSNTADISMLPTIRRVPDSIDNVYMASAGSRHILAIRNFVGGVGGELWVWGLDTTGSIGGATSYEWTQVGVDSDWSFVSAAGNSSMAIKAGALYATGAGGSYVFGNNSTANISTFTQIGVDTDWEMISIADGFSLAVKNGELYSCGSNQNYKTGLNINSGNTQVWTLVDNTESWSFVNGGRAHAAAVTSDGKLFTWGLNSFGRTVQGTTVGETQIPTQVGSDTDWVMCTCSNQNTYALKSNGTLYGGGSSNGAIWGNTTSPTTLTQDSTNATDWKWVMTGSGNSVLAVKNSNTLYGAGLAFGNGLKTNENELKQVGTDQNYSTLFYGNNSGFSTEIALIKT